MLASILDRWYQYVHGATQRAFGRKAARGAPGRYQRRRLRLESLEDRRLLSVSPVGAEFQVNSYTTSQQITNVQGQSAAADGDGDFVVTWQSVGQDGDGYGVFAQRYDAVGMPEGSEFRVNSYTTGSQYAPSVALDADGDFVITWSSFGQDGSRYGVYAQRYNAAGVAQGGELRVNSYSTNDQRYSSVALDAAGDFVITWTSYTQEGSGFGVYAQRYNAAGVAQGSEFQVNSYTTSQQFFSSVALDANGDFVITWSSNTQDGSNYGIYAQRYNAAGVPQGSEFQVNSYTTNNQLLSGVSLAADGDFVITWSSNGQDESSSLFYGVYAQRYNAAGVPQGSEFQVNSYTTGHQFFPSVALDAAGDFAITWSSFYQDGNGWGVYGQRYNAVGMPQESEFRINTYTTDMQRSSSVALDAAGDFVITWSSYTQDGNSYGIYAQRYDESTDTAGPIVAGVYAADTAGTPDTHLLTEGEREVSAIPKVVVSFSEDLATSGAASVTSTANWQLMRQGVDITSQITGIAFTFNAPRNRYEAVLSLAAELGDGDYTLTARSFITDLAGNRLDGDFDGAGFGEDFTRSFTIARAVTAGSEFQVNSYTTNSQVTDFLAQAVATDAAGDYVITWMSYGEDGSSDGIYAQRYNAAGVPQGSEFRVNSYTTNFQRSANVALDADGDFVISWSSYTQDGDGYGIYAQRYDAAGVAQGSEFRVNPYTTNQQRFSSVALEADGDFVITWSSDAQDGSSYGIYAQRYNAAGLPQGSEFRVNSYTTGWQNYSSVALDADGDFVVTWISLYQDGDGFGIYAQRYNAAGVPQGSEFQVNSYTTGNQAWSSVALDADGDFVITWSSNTQDAGSYGVYAQRYSAAGVAQGSEFRVNSYATNSQYFSSVALDSDGDFVITWSSKQQDGSGYGVYAQRYNAAGVAEGSEFRANPYTNNQQRFSSVALEADGDFLITWSSYGQDGDRYGVYAQRYAATARVAEVRVVGDTSAIDPGERLIAMIPAGASPAVTFSREMSQAGGAAGAHSATNPANYTLTQDGVDISAQITSISYAGTTATLTLASPLGTGSYVLTAKETNQDTDARALDGDADGTPGADFTRAFTIDPPVSTGSEFRVNTYVTGRQSNTFPGRGAAADAAGDFVITWTSEPQDGSGRGIYAQRYNAAGVPQGSEFRVNSYTNNDQLYSSVALDAAGDFVVTWSSGGQDGSGYGIYAQRYNAVGVPQGSEFRVNSYTTGNQLSASVALDADGDFVITWSSNTQDGSGYGIYAQRYNAAGVAQGSEFRVNSYTTSDQVLSSVALAADGDFVITWSSLYQDGDKSGIYAQRYNAAGVPQGSEFRVNSYTTSYQDDANVALDAAGDFVITWSSDEQDGSNRGIFAQRYDAAGVPQGSEFHVNSYTTGYQNLPSVALDADGDFVIAWTSSQQVGSVLDIYAQRYDAAGVPQGSEFRVNSYTTSVQEYPSVALDADGDFVITWTSSYQDGFFTGIYAQRFAVADRAGPIVTGVYPADAAGTPDTHLLTEGEREVEAIPNLVVSFSENLATSGAGSVTSTANWRLMRQGVDITSQITGIAFAYNARRNRYEAVLSLTAPLSDGDYALTARSLITDLAGNRLDGDFDGSGFSEDFTRSFTIAQAVTAGSEFQVNTYTTSSQLTNFHGQSVATDAAGDFVITWSGYGQDGDGNDVYAQRYNAEGVPQGSEFRVNAYTTAGQVRSSVALDADGDFVITWSSNGQDDSGYGIYAQRYNAAGVPQGSEFRVNSYRTSDQLLSTVALDADGDFVITWTSAGQDGGAYGVYAQRYNAAGVPQGSEFRVNSYTTDRQFFSTVALDADGDFVITWSSDPQDGSGWGIYAQRYNAAGVPQGSEFRVNSYTTGSQLLSSVAVDADGDFVITWESYGQDGNNWGIYAQRYDAAGVPQGSEFLVNSYTTHEQEFSSVALDADGDFVVTWSSFFQYASSFDIYAQRYNAAGVPQGSEFRVNSYESSGQLVSSVALDADGDFVIAWRSYMQDGDSYGVYAQRYAASARVAEVRGVGDTSAIDPGERLVATIPAGASLAVTFSRDMSQLGGAGGANSVTNPANYTLTQNAVDVSAQITSISYAGTTATLTLASPLGTGSYVLTAKQTIQDADARALDGDADGIPGADFTRAFTIDPPTSAGSEFQVNTYTTNSQVTNFRGQSVATDAAGDYVITWASFGQDGDGNAVYAQRYNAAGVPQGSEFLVNSYTSNHQADPSVARDADGDFVITWASNGQDGSGYGIYAQRYNAAGVPQGSEFRVNSYTTNNQWFSSVALDADGDFVITWSSSGQDGSAYGVYAQRYNAAGVPQGSEFRVNSFTTNSQLYSSVALAADGDFVITWSSYSQDDSDFDVYAQRYNAAGIAQGSEFRINSNMISRQFLSSVALAADGDFVITWSSYGQDDHEHTGVYAQCYNAAGVPQGSEFRVNSYTTSDQSFPTVALDADGDFVIAWSSYAQDGSGSGIYAQRYNAGGVAQGSEFRVNSNTGSHQYLSSVALASDGDFVIAWQSYAQDGSDWGVYAQRYAANQAPTTTGLASVNVLEDAADTLVNLLDAFDDAHDGAGGLTYTVQTNSNPTLFSSTDITSGQLTLDYAPDANGLADLTIRATDSSGLFVDSTFTVTVTAVNDAPSFTVGADETVNEDAGPQTVSVWATGIVAGPSNESTQTATFNVTGNTNTALFEAGPTINAAGDLTYTPAANAFGTATITLSLTDDGGTSNGGVDTSAVQTFTITVNSVNDAPSFVAGPSQTVNEDSGAQSVHGWAAGISKGPANEAGQTFSFNVTGNTNAALFENGPGVNFSGDLTYTPAANAFGTATITLTLMDNGGTANGGVNTSAVHTFTITVNPVNDAPSFVAGVDQTIDEDADSQTVSGWATAISQGPANESDQTLTFNVTGNTNVALFSAGPAVSSTGALTYTPAANAFGTATITLVLTDNGGTANGGVETSAVQTFTITVNPVNDAPSFVAGASQTVNEDVGSQTVPGWATGISKGPGNEAGQTLTFNVTGNSNAGLFSAGPAVSSTGALTYTPAANAFGTATITLALSDNGGTANGGVDTSAVQTFTIMVNSVNDAPSFVAGASQTVNEDSGSQTVAGWATGISKGPGNEAGQTLAFNVTGNTNAALFLAGPAVSSTGALTYTPAANAFGTATITLALSDNGGTANGGIDTSAARVFTIKVNSVNDAPSFVRGVNQTVNENSGPQTVSPWATAIVAGPTNESTQIVSFSVTGNTNPGLFAAGPAVASNGTLTYTPASGAFGSATMTLVLTDDGGTANGGVNAASTVVFSVTVNATNSAPSFTAGASQTVNEDGGRQTVSPWATSIMAGPPNESTQTVSFSVTANSNPALFSAGPAVSSTGVLTYTAAANAFGVATITLVLSDNGGTANGGLDTSAPQSFRITVNAVNDAPSFGAVANQTVSANAGPQTVVGWATGIVAGPANESTQTVGFAVSGNTNPGLFAAAPSVSSTGTLTYRTATAAVGSATITLILADNGGTANGGANTSPPRVFTITARSADILAVGADAGSKSQPAVKVFDPLTKALKFTILPSQTYGATYRGGVRVATGDIDGDGVPDIVTAPGRNMAPAIKVFSGVNGSLIRTIAAASTYGIGFTSGVYVGVGDVTGDGKNDIVLSPELGAATILVFSNTGSGFSLLRSFDAFPDFQHYSGGATVAVADVSGDTRAEVVVGTGPGVPAQVWVYAVTAISQTRLLSIADPSRFTGGVFVAAGNVTGDGKAEIITGSGAGPVSQGAGSTVRIYNGATGAAIRSFQAFTTPPSVNPPVRVTVRNGQLYVVQGQGGQSQYQVRKFDALGNYNAVDSFFAGLADPNDPYFSGGGLFIG